MLTKRQDVQKKFGMLRWCSLRSVELDYSVVVGFPELLSTAGSAEPQHNAEAGPLVLLAGSLVFLHIAVAASADSLDIAPICAAGV